MFFSITTVLAQENSISGVVTDISGEPLIGVNIIEDGTNNGTQTDFDGYFTLNVDAEKTIVFSFIGYISVERKISDSNNSYNVQLQEDASELQEVVVTGYSRRNKTVQTSAVVSISASEIAELTPSTSIDNLIQGKAAGVQVTAANGKPGEGAFVRIRGVGSLSAGASSPLYIVDGSVVREQDLGTISNQDIENLSILKDAATTARYGSRGANGVVVITTKSGNRNKDAEIRFSSRFGYSERIQPNFDVMDASQKCNMKQNFIH